MTIDEVNELCAVIASEEAERRVGAGERGVARGIRALCSA